MRSGARQRMRVGRMHVRARGGRRSPARAAVAARQRMRVGRMHMHVRDIQRPPARAAVGARQRMRVGRVDVRARGGRRPPARAAVGARQRMRVGRVDVRASGARRPPARAAVGARQLMRVGRAGDRVSAEAFFCATSDKMNQEHANALEKFVTLHTHRIPAPAGEPLAYLVAYAPQIPLSVKLFAFSSADIVSRFDTNAMSVRWLLRQMQRADHHTESLIGLHFADGTVLAHTVVRGAIRSFEDSENET